jgi:hypothetical protein
MAITRFIPVHGSGGMCQDESPRPHKDHWYEPKHPFGLFMATHGVIPHDPYDSFQWSGDLDGTFGFLPWKWFGNKDHRDWKAGGEALRYYLQNVPLEHRNIICHSHGMQVVMYAVGGRLGQKPLPINKLITVGSPVRKDMAKQMAKARPHIRYWEHIFDPKDDEIQVAGEIGDGKVGVTREIDIADRNTGKDHIRHSSILREPTGFHWWIDLGIIDRFTNV